MPQQVFDLTTTNLVFDEPTTVRFTDIRGGAHEYELSKFSAAEISLRQGMIRSLRAMFENIETPSTTDMYLALVVDAWIAFRMTDPDLEFEVVHRWFDLSNEKHSDLLLLVSSVAYTGAPPSESAPEPSGNPPPPESS